MQNFPLCSASSSTQLRSVVVERETRMMFSLDLNIILYVRVFARARFFSSDQIKTVVVDKLKSAPSSQWETQVFFQKVVGR